MEKYIVSESTQYWISVILYNKENEYELLHLLRLQNETIFKMGFLSDNNSPLLENITIFETPYLYFYEKHTKKICLHPRILLHYKNCYIS